ncbi:MAG: hypothetical protein ACTIJA_03130 [Bavariicoccus seileri]|uniref:hypothetical protein n=1 Tax=Bavariicoccus seileri TaxID=549685 RepID=UPI003F9BA0D2
MLKTFLFLLASLLLVGCSNNNIASDEAERFSKELGIKDYEPSTGTESFKEDTYDVYYIGSYGFTASDKDGEAIQTNLTFDNVDEAESFIDYLGFPITDEIKNAIYYTEDGPYSTEYNGKFINVYSINRENILVIYTDNEKRIEELQ